MVKTTCRPSPFLPAGLAALAAAAAPIAAQCPNLRWTGQFSTPATGLARGTQLGLAYGLQVFDPDSAGPAPSELFVAGNFATAGGVASPGIASWNGQRWAAVGGGIAPPNESVYGIGVHDPDGPGPQNPVLVVAGSFTSIGGTPANRIAAWNGASWSALGSGFEDVFGHTVILDFDADGPGPLPPSLVVGGGQSITPYSAIVRWDGAHWSAIPDAPGGIFAMAVFDEDGPGPLNPALFAGVDYTPGIYKWDGISWAVVAGGLADSALHRCAALTVIDEDGPGPGRSALFVGGQFSTAGGVPAPNIARWDGQEWSAVGTGLFGQVEDIVAVDYTAGAGAPTIYAATAIVGSVFRYEPGPEQWIQVGQSNAAFGIITLFRLASLVDSGSAIPSLYYSGPGLHTVNSVTSRGLARYSCACYANCDGSASTPILNVNDFICFLNRFNAQYPYANCDGSTTPPVLNVNDFVCYQTRFVAGCP